VPDWPEDGAYGFIGASLGLPNCYIQLKRQKNIPFQLDIPNSNTAMITANMPDSCKNGAKLTKTPISPMKSKFISS
jgi:hypothetical protein